MNDSMSSVLACHEAWIVYVVYIGMNRIEIKWFGMACETVNGCGRDTSVERSLFVWLYLTLRINSTDVRRLRGN